MKFATPAEIHAEILRRIQTSDALDGDCRDDGAPTTHWSNEPNVKGTHWIVNTFPNSTPGCLETVQAIVLEVMEEYDLHPPGKTGA
jgi:hypothetical protein